MKEKRFMNGIEDGETVSRELKKRTKKARTLPDSPNLIIPSGGVLVKEKTMAQVDLLNNSTIYLVKDGKLITYELPEYGETRVITLGGKVDRLETTTKTKI